MISLNSYEEIELTERLLSHPYSSMTRYARTGGEACSIAVRIARAAAGKDGVAFVVIIGGMIGIFLLIFKI